MYLARLSCRSHFVLYCKLKKLDHPPLFLEELKRSDQRLSFFLSSIGMERNGKTKGVCINPSYEHPFVYPNMQTLYIPFVFPCHREERKNLVLFKIISCHPPLHPSGKNLDKHIIPTIS